MATLDTLKRTFRQKAAEAVSSPASSAQKLSDSQYSAGFNILMRDQGYHDFIIPQLSLLLAPLLGSRPAMSILEVGPGPRSVLGHLPRYVRQKIRRYAAFEPNNLFASQLQEWLCASLETEAPLPYLEEPPDIKRARFVPNNSTRTGGSDCAEDGAEEFDVVLFCHSLYGMKPKHEPIKCALNLIAQSPAGGLVVAFHRGETLDCDGMVCYRTAIFPTGIIRVADHDEVLDCFSRSITGYVMQDPELDKAIQSEWRKVCRSLGRREEAHPDQLSFDSPSIMVAFNQQAYSLPKLISEVQLVQEHKKIKSWEARGRHPASIVRPTDARQVQQCIRWALDHGLSLTVLGGGHSGHCLWPNVVTVDMSAFDQVHVLPTAGGGEISVSNHTPLVVVGAGCKSGDVIRKTMEAGLTVPLGARPSVGAGLWLQGGIGHLARLHGLACDSVVGAVLVSAASGEIFCIGSVPSQHQPAGAVRPQDESDLIWALKGAGTNIGILVSITFKAYAAPTYLIRNWVSPLHDKLEARRKLKDFDELIAKKLSRQCSADAYLYWNEDKLYLGATMFESSTSGFASEEWDPAHTSTVEHADTLLGPEKTTSLKNVNGSDLFETEMYMSGMHGGHGGGKTSTFKRCVFLKRIGAVDIAETLVAAIETRPSPLCYLHLLQGGGAVRDVVADATAFGCRDWGFACVVTGVWARDHDRTEVAREVVQWVYKVVGDLLPLSTGVYGADLGLDPRDALLAVKAFGPNQSRLAHLKRTLDPKNVLAYACPLKDTSVQVKLVILVTGESCAGKDHCADLWRSVFTTDIHKGLRARRVSISDAVKQEYAAAMGIDLERLLHDRAFKSQHRPALTDYFHEKLQQRPRLLEEQCLRVLYNSEDVDVLLITGMRDKAPVASYSHLLSGGRLLEVRVETSKEIRQARRGCSGGDGNKGSKEDRANRNGCPSLIFNNDVTGNDAAKAFCKDYLVTFLHDDLQRLANMVRPVPSFPRPDDHFRHVLEISQRPGGLPLCTSLLQTHFIGDWAKVDAVACCETGGWVFASALAARVNIPFVLIREAGKLPPPTISISKFPSHISSSTCERSTEKRIEVGRGVIPKDASVLVVDDVLATGNTLCAVLQLLGETGVCAEDVIVMVVAEFPYHRGRQLLRQRGFGGARVQSLLIFDGA